MLQLSDEDLSEFKEIFGLVDTDGSGKISPQELGQLTKKLGLNYTEKQLETMVREIDVDKNGEIDFEEFIAVMSRQVQPAYTPEDLKHAFKVFCDHADNKISVNVLEKALMERTTEKLNREKAQKLLQQLDPTGLGVIDYIDFVNVMTFS